MPLFGSDLSSSLLIRQDFSKVKSVQHRIYREINKQTLAKKKQSTPLNQALSLFSQASVNMHDSEMFEGTFMLFKDSDATPKIEELGYLT